MRTLRWIVAFVVLGSVSLWGQGGLSNQVLQLLTRVNTWTAKNTFNDLRFTNAAIPSDTTYRIYPDTSGNLYFNGGLIAGAGGGVTPHNFLSTTHPDTLVGSPARGAVVIGNATPKWALYQPSVSGCLLQYNGTDTICATAIAGATSIPAANLTGTIAAISGVNLTNLNANNLASGTVPIARLSGITNTQIDAAAGIAYSKLNLAASVVLTSDVTGVLPLANGGTGLSTAANNTTPVSTGTAWVARTISDCHDGTHALAFTQSTNLFSCQALSSLGTVTSVALSLPAIITVSGSPVTSAGTLTGTLATQTANFLWAGPTTGAAAAPTFRALVAADIPSISAAKLTSGVAAIGDGTSGAPAYSFAAQPTIGVYRFASGQIGVTGLLAASTDATYDLGVSITANRFRHAFFTGTVTGTAFQVGPGTATINNALLRSEYVTSGGSFGAGMVGITTGDQSALGDLRLARIAAGAASDTSFVDSIWNFRANPTTTPVGAQRNFSVVVSPVYPLAYAFSSNAGYFELSPGGTHNFTGGDYTGVYGGLYPSGSGTWTELNGVIGDPEASGTGAVAAVFSIKGYCCSVAPVSGTASTIQKSGFFHATQPFTSAVPPVAHKAIWVEDQTAGGTFVPSGTNYALHIETVSNLKDIIITAAGKVEIFDLKTGGAATGKKVVCVDTATGILYSSSTGTDCSN